MEDSELTKIAEQAAKHIMPSGHMDKLLDAARKYGKPFKGHTEIIRKEPPSERLVKIRKQSKADEFLYGKREPFDPMATLKSAAREWSK